MHIRIEPEGGVARTHLCQRLWRCGGSMDLEVSGSYEGLIAGLLT